MVNGPCGGSCSVIAKVHMTNNRRISPERIAHAAAVIDPVFLNSPQFLPYSEKIFQPKNHSAEDLPKTTGRLVLPALRAVVFDALVRIPHCHGQFPPPFQKHYARMHKRHFPRDASPD